VSSTRCRLASWSETARHRRLMLFRPQTSSARSSSALRASQWHAARRSHGRGYPLHFWRSIGDMYKVCVSEPAEPCAERDGLIIRVREDHDGLWEGSGITLRGGCSLQLVKGSQFRAHPEAELRALQLSFPGMRGE
jgi:hypothetical protein